MSELAAEKRARDSFIFKREENDHYAEPCWVSERLFEHLDLAPGTWVHDPACGFGRIVRSARKYGLNASGADIEPRWLGCPDDGIWNLHDYKIRNFLNDEAALLSPEIIASNPPFKHAEAFVERALKLARSRVAMLLPTKWVQGDKRSRWLEGTPLHLVMPITPRPSMPPGEVWLSGEKIGGGTVDFAWFVWLRGYRGQPTIEWLRKEP